MIFFLIGNEVTAILDFGVSLPCKSLLCVPPKTINLRATATKSAPSRMPWVNRAFPKASSRQTHPAKDTDGAKRKGSFPCLHPGQQEPQAWGSTKESFTAQRLI